MKHNIIIFNFERNTITIQGQFRASVGKFKMWQMWKFYMDFIHYAMNKSNVYTYTINGSTDGFIVFHNQQVK